MLYQLTKLIFLSIISLLICRKFANKWIKSLKPILPWSLWTQKQVRGSSNPLKMLPMFKQELSSILKSFLKMIINFLWLVRDRTKALLFPTTTKLSTLTPSLKRELYRKSFLLSVLVISTGQAPLRYLLFCNTLKKLLILDLKSLLVWKFLNLCTNCTISSENDPKISLI